MYEFVDKYCERVLPGVLGEPLNALSNLAYLIAGVLLIRLFKANDNVLTSKSWDIITLIFLLFLIGIGSGVWHIYAQNWALYVDVIPILLFINLYILSCLIRVLKCSVIVTVSIFLCYHLFNFALQYVFDKDFLNGSIFYLPTWLFLVSLSVLFWKTQRHIAQQFLTISLIFGIALTFRSVDLQICDIFMPGTHFMWHIITAYMMYKLCQMLINDTRIKFPTKAHIH